MYLLKTEPSEYSYDDLEREGKTVWNGVKNPLAQRFISQMKKGELCLIYHTGDERVVMGVAMVVGEPYKDEQGYWVVDVEPYVRLKKPVSLSVIRNLPQAQGSYLLRMPRLSVMPISKELWDAILSLSS